MKDFDWLQVHINDSFKNSSVKVIIKESQSTKMHCALKFFDSFVFRHFVSQFIDEILTSETYPYQSALFLDIFSIVEIC